MCSRIIYSVFVFIHVDQFVFMYKIITATFNMACSRYGTSKIVRPLSLKNGSKKEETRESKDTPLIDSRKQKIAPKRIDNRFATNVSRHSPVLVFQNLHISDSLDMQEFNVLGNYK